jgi:hypothetical protein
MGSVLRWLCTCLRVWLAGALLTVVALAAAGAVASGQVTAVACGASTSATVANVDAMVASNVYGGELDGTETKIDMKHVMDATDLLAAVGADDRVATLKAAEGIVYHPFWHIVRLRVLGATGRVLADFGGPYVIAPVSGILRHGGLVVGSFVMSVQDDLGFAKLEHRFVGDAIGIYVGGRRAVEWGGDLPYRAPTGTGVNVDGVEDGFVTRTYDAFPSGRLSALLAVPTPSAELAAQPCAAVVVAEIGRVAERIAARFRPLASNYIPFVEVVHSYTGAIAIVRIDQRPIAGSEGLGPLSLPTSGTVNYLGKNWSVFSFAPTPPARIYLLIAQP